jgi:hypothetical protein
VHVTSPGTPVSSTNKTDRHDITEILFKVAFKAITPPNGIQYKGQKKNDKKTNKS